MNNLKQLETREVPWVKISSTSVRFRRSKQRT